MGKLTSDGSLENFTSEAHGSLFDDDFEEEVIETQEDEKEEFDIFEDVENSRKGEDEDEEDGFKEQPTTSKLITSILKSKGIEDPSKIKYENEDGEIEEIDFYSLPEEDQLNILNLYEQEEKEDDNDLIDDEIDLLNFMRENNFNKEDLIKFYKNQALEEYQNSLQPSFSVDEYSDEDLYFSRLKEMFPNATDEELVEELEKAQSNEELFKKRADSIREYYKNAELEMIQNQKAEQQALEEQELLEFTNSVVAASNEIEYINELQLEPQDKEDVNSYILNKDANGASKFAKDLNDPKKLFLAAWFLLKGDEAFNFIHDYYKKEIENSRKSVKKTEPKEQPKTSKVVVKQTKEQPVNKNNQNRMSLHDLYE